ncbi:type II toxin-antitoxin system RelE/ParE family toxin [Sphingomonas sp. PB4P5]|uniref:type II toxin-antitoxin system RelE/ParE family toxin n=1 Tax=Parasphingomonas puruogangriensis TaxID=3096155 RepID=UPI002FCA4B47
MPKVVWSDAATDHLDFITSYIELFDVNAAAKIAERLWKIGESLSDFPQRGRPAGHGERELVNVRPYILRYTVEHDVVLILSIRHSAQQSSDYEA